MTDEASHTGAWVYNSAPVQFRLWLLPTKKGHFVGLQIPGISRGIFRLVVKPITFMVSQHTP